MNTQALKGAWEQIKGSLKEKYATLTDDDLKHEIATEKAKKTTHKK